MSVLVIGILYFVSYVLMNENRRKVALPPPHRVLLDGLLVWDGRMEKILKALLVTGRVALTGLVDFRPARDPDCDHYELQPQCRTRGVSLRGHRPNVADHRPDTDHQDLVRCGCVQLGWLCAC